MRVRRLHPLAFVALLALAACSASEPPAPSGPRPHVVLITLDTTRADALGCYGGPADATPNLDRLASEGALFENAIAQAAVTPVSHASILTGLHPFHHGLRVLHGTNENRLSASASTLAELLRAQGYRTGAFLSAFPAGARFGLEQGFERFDEDFLVGSETERVTGDGVVNTGLNQRAGHVTTERALEWLAQQGDEPFLIWAHYFDPHDTYVLPPDEFMRGLPPAPADERERLRAAYAIEVRFMDQQIGALLAGIARHAGEREVVVVVVADHGEGLGDHDWWTHGLLYQEQIRVPMLVKAPGVAPGRRIAELARTVDLLPTVLSAAGLAASAPAELDGVDLMPALRGATAMPALLAYADSINTLVYSTSRDIQDEKTEVLFAVVEGRWKYIHHLGAPDASELYDLAADPRELDNRFAAEPEQVERMRRALSQFDFLPRAALGLESMSDEDAKRLESLGYSR